MNTHEARAIDRVDRVGPAGGPTVRALRHVFAAVGVLIGLGLLLAAGAYLLHPRMPSLVTKCFVMPDHVPTHVWWVLVGLVPAPEQLGRVAAVSEPVVSQRWGRMVVIRLDRPIRVTGQPQRRQHESGKQDEW